MQISWQAIEERIRSDFPDVDSISPDELAAWLADESRTDPLIIDARAEEEFAVSHLKNAQHATTVDKVVEIAGERSCVVYCSVGIRSVSYTHLTLPTIYSV